MKLGAQLGSSSDRAVTKLVVPRGAGQAPVICRHILIRLPAESCRAVAHVAIVPSNSPDLLDATRVKCGGLTSVYLLLIFLEAKMPLLIYTAYIYRYITACQPVANPYTRFCASLTRCSRNAAAHLDCRAVFGSYGCCKLCSQPELPQSVREPPRTGCLDSPHCEA